MRPLPEYFDGIRLPRYVFYLTLGMLMLVSGVHVGLITLLHETGGNEIVLVHVVLLYWVAVAVGMTLYIQRQTRKFYEEPIRRIASAAGQVARGDFSVYLPPVHTPDHLDCLDALTEDFNRMVEALGSIETLKTEFFSNVSHEIKTPIAVVMNTAELLRNESLSPQGAARACGDDYSRLQTALYADYGHSQAQQAGEADDFPAAGGLRPLRPACRMRVAV